jgi:hypothetical protein
LVLRSFGFAYRDKKVVIVFVRFRAPLQPYRREPHVDGQQAHLQAEGSDGGLQVRHYFLNQQRPEQQQRQPAPGSNNLSVAGLSIEQE